MRAGWTSRAGPRDTSLAGGILGPRLAEQRARTAYCGGPRYGGIEVWFDESELRRGDAWDQKLRREIQACALFIPVISANVDVTQFCRFDF